MKASERTERVLHGINRRGRGIEVGPSFSPVAPRSAGFDTLVVDHDTREGLIAKYRHDPQVDLSRIEEVDRVWRGGPLHELFEERKAFDFVIASHVIEHLPDPIAFLRSVSLLLKDDGVLSLAVPDKRYCFDHLRPITLTPSLIAAFLERRSRHTPEALLAYELYTSTVRGSLTWGPGRTVNARRIEFLGKDPRDGYGKVTEYLKAGCEPYTDTHAWCFTPSSFALCLLELNHLGLVDLVVDHRFDTRGCEFLVTLKRGSVDPAGVQDRRLRLLEAVHGEQAVPWGRLGAAVQRLRRVAAALRGLGAR